MKQAVRPLVTVALLALVVAGAYGVGYYRGAAPGTASASAVAKAGFEPSPGTTPTVGARERFETFWEAWNLVEREFYNPEVIDYQKMTYGAIRGMLETLGDTHTTLVDPSHSRISEQEMRGSFDGIGVSVEMKAGRLTIVAPLDDSPGAKAGLRAADVIVMVDDRDISAMTMPQAIALIRGPRGTKVRITIEREDEPLPLVFEITRAEIRTVTVKGEMKGDIAYVKVSQFAQPTPALLEQKLKVLLASQPKALVLDLRNNPGGLLSSAIGVASQFIGNGVVMYEQRKDTSEETYPALKGGLAINLPIAVLVNKGSASASEIVAGAVQDRQRGVLIGESTFGKDTVQNVHNLGDASSLRITVARWYTPNKQAISGKGLTPDISVELDSESMRTGADPQLERALEWARTGA